MQKVIFIKGMCISRDLKIYLKEGINLSLWMKHFLTISDLLKLKYLVTINQKLQQYFEFIEI